MKHLRKVFASVFALGLALVLAGFNTPAYASVTVHGTVQCTTSAVEGVWVSSSSGGSGWANWSQVGNEPNVATFSRSLPSLTSYHINVGCGGSPDSWTVTASSSNVSSNGLFFTCSDYEGSTGYCSVG